MELALRSFSHEKGYSAPLTERIGIDEFSFMCRISSCCPVENGKKEIYEAEAQNTQSHGQAPPRDRFRQVYAP